MKDSKHTNATGRKIQSSSRSIEEANKNFHREHRPWGYFDVHGSGDGWYLKTLTVAPGKRLSLQYHHHRQEYWMLVEGEATATVGPSMDELAHIPLKKQVVQEIPQGAIHRLESKNGGTVVEISYGDFQEDDIVRIEDDHGRVA